MVGDADFVVYRLLVFAELLSVYDLFVLGGMSVMRFVDLVLFVLVTIDFVIN